MFVKVNDLWRVGYHADPLSVSLEYQGNGRFDDPFGECTVLYGSDSVDTCIMEIALPWVLHTDASYVQRTEAPESAADSELQQAELDDAERDREVAMTPPHMPADLYDKAKVYVELAESIVVLDLDDISVRRDLAQVPSIAEYMSANGLPDLDRSVLAGRHLDLTRIVSGHLIRHPFAGHQFAGIQAQSRHSGMTLALFEGHYKLRTPMVGPIRLTPDDPDVLRIAQRIRLVP